MGVSNAKAAKSELDARIDALFDESQQASTVPESTQRVILTNLRQAYANQLVQQKAEMRIALRLNDVEGQKAIRMAAGRTLAAIDEIDVMLSELPAPNGKLPPAQNQSKQVDSKNLADALAPNLPIDL